MQTLIDAVLRDKPTDRLVWTEAGATVAEAVARMATERVGAILGEDRGRVVRRHLHRARPGGIVHAGLSPATTPLSLVMTRDVRFVTPGTTVEAALSLMHMNRHRHLLVIDGPRVHGLISIGDLVRHLIEHGEGRFEAAVRATTPEPPSAKA